MPTYIVECATCQQPWEVPVQLLTTREQRISIPGHMLADVGTMELEPRPCPGSAFPGIGMGERGLWERMWPLTHGDRPLPELLDGSAVKLADPN